MARRRLTIAAYCPGLRIPALRSCLLFRRSHIFKSLDALYAGMTRTSAFVVSPEIFARTSAWLS